MDKWFYPTHYRRGRDHAALFAGAGLAAGAIWAVTRWRPLQRVTVEGWSMLPTLEPGDRLLVGPVRRLQPGQLIAIGDPRRPDRLMVKRVHLVTDGWVEVRGDNPTASTDSRQLGPVPAALVRGRILYRYAPAGRVGPVERSPDPG